MSKKISALTELIVLENEDLFPIVDSSEVTLSLKTKKVKLGTIVAFLSSIPDSNFEAYDDAFEYQGGTTYFVSFENNIYEYISADDHTDVDPDSDDTIWSLSSAGAFAHEKNKDQYLDFGGANEVAVTNIVKLSGTQTITGAKTFSSQITGGGGILIQKVVGNQQTGLASSHTNVGFQYTNSDVDFNAGVTANINGVGIISAPGDWFAYLKTSNLGSDQTYEFPASGGTLANTSDLGDYLLLSGGELTGPIAGTDLYLLVDGGYTKAWEELTQTYVAVGFGGDQVYVSATGISLAVSGVGHDIELSSNNGDVSISAVGAASIAGTSVTIAGTPIFSSLTASTVPVLDGSKNLISSSVTPTQLSYLDATSSIQTQLNSKGSGTITSVSGTSNRITSTGGANPVIDISASYVGQSSITTVGTIATGVWNATVLGSTYGGTGVNNGSNTITLAGNLVTTGAFNTTFAASATATMTLPGSSQTLAGLAVTGQTFTTVQRFTGATTEITSLTLLDTTYKSALSGASGVLTIGSGFTSLVSGGLTTSLTGNVTMTSSNVIVFTASTGGGAFSFRRSGTISGLNTAFVDASIDNVTYAPTTSGSGSYKAIGIITTINQTGTANQDVMFVDVNPTLTATLGNVYGVRSRIASATNRYNIYADGTASNYLAGNTGIGTTSTTTSILSLGASTTAKSSLNIPSGTAPSSPVNGDIWSDGSDIKVRLGGVTYTLTKV